METRKGAERKKGKNKEMVRTRMFKQGQKRTLYKAGAYEIVGVGVDEDGEMMVVSENC
jgi:hypothetical protein